MIPEGYSVRAATWDDLQAVVTLLRDCDMSDWGSPDVDEGDLRHEWGMPELDMATDTWLVLDEAGSPVGYSWLLARADHTALDTWGAVHPRHRGRGVGPSLLDLMERRAGEHAAQTPAGREVRIHNHVIGPDRPAHALLEARGYRLARHSWRMDVKLEAEPVATKPPEGISVRRFRPEEDARTVHAVVEEAFAEHWGWVPRSFEDWATVHLHERLDPDLWLLACDGPDVAGVLLGGVSEGIGWVETLGVRPAWRGRGIGEHLLRLSFAEFHRRGLPDVSLNVDAGNETGATRLYERVGMHMARVYDTYEKRMR
jgi:mycothiol synthase